MESQKLSEYDPINFRSDTNVELRGPTVQTTGAVAAGGFCQARLFDDSKDDIVTETVAIGSNVIPVRSPKKFQIGDSITIDIGVTQYDAGPITSISVPDSTITVTNNAGAEVKPGADMKVKLGANVAMPLYGTPVPGSYDWGYRGVITDGHEDLKIGMNVRIEITFVGADTNQTRIFIMRTTVVGGNNA